MYRSIAGTAAGTLVGVAALALPVVHHQAAAAQPRAGRATVAHGAVTRAASVAARGATRSGAVPRRAAPWGPGPVVYAHRAGAAYAPENTVAAVESAARRGLPWVECDVQRTKDGKLVILHDETLNRTTNVEKLYPKLKPWKVGSLTLKQVERLDAGSWFGAKFKGTKVPTLRAYLDALNHTGQSVLLELKNPQLYPGLAKQTLGQLRAAGWLDAAHLRSRIVIQSFDADALRTTHRLDPAITLGYLGAPAPDKLASYGRFVDQINPEDSDVTYPYIEDVHGTRGAHGRRLAINVWTVDDTNTAERLAALGVDGLISNKPVAIRDAVDYDD
jgi:glycerophosphoryl diester phosphodiesterase